MSIQNIFSPLHYYATIHKFVLINFTFCFDKEPIRAKTSKTKRRDLLASVFERALQRRHLGLALAQGVAGPVALLDVAPQQGVATLAAALDAGAQLGDAPAQRRHDSRQAAALVDQPPQALVATLLLRFRPAPAQDNQKRTILERYFGSFLIEVPKF